MIAAERCLHVLGHALAAHALYGPGHQARRSAGDRLYTALRDLLAADGRPAFTFLDRAVIYRAVPVHGLSDWVWARRLSAAGVRRLEFGPSVTTSSLEEFLMELHLRLGGEGRGEPMPPCEGIEAGDVSLTTTAESEPVPAPAPVLDAVFSLGSELSAVQHAFGRVTAGVALPLDELDAVVRALTVALRQEGELLIPLVSLRTQDDYAAMHAVNTSILAMTFSEWLGLAGGDIRAIGKAGLLHDIGMARVPKDVFQASAMTASGRAGVARHPEEGARLLLARSSRLDLAATTAYEHHLRMDGQGYPARRFHRDLHYISRVISVCGAYDALRSVRSYRPALTPEAAIGEIEAGAGTVYDAGVAGSFVQMIRRWEHRLVKATPD